MQFKFRYTDREYLHSRRINRLSWIPKWKSLGLALICLLPSVALVVLTSSFIAVMGFIAVAVYLVAAVSFALLRQPSQNDKHDHDVTLSSSVYHESSSHSEFELSWQYFDEFIEHEDEFLLRRLDRFIYLPKRIFTPEESGQLRLFAAALSALPSGAERPVPLFDKLFPKDRQERIFRFQFQSDDLVQAALDPLAIVNLTTLESTIAKPAGKRLAAVWIGLFVLVSVFLLRPEGSATIRWTPTQYLLLVTALLLPFGLLLGANRLLRAWSAKRLPQVPLDENRLVVLPNGFGIGTPKNVTFYDWRDIDAFYENQSCYGFKSFNDLIQVIPKRIFNDNAESTAFFHQAISLHREYRRTFETGATAIETGNPYQPPVS